MQVLNTVLPLGSSLVSFVFAAVVFDQWRQRHRSFQLVWTVGLLFYGISAGTEFLGSAFGWNEPLYRVWYLVGALYVAAYLGAGTVYLLNRTRFGFFVASALGLGGVVALLLVRKYPSSTSTADIVAAAAFLAATVIVGLTIWRRELVAPATMAFLVAASGIVAFLVLTAQVASPGYALDSVTRVPVGNAMPGYIRVLTGPFNVAGALSLVFGAIYSAYVYMPKKKVLPARYSILAIVVNLIASLPRAFRALLEGRLNSRVPATILIALGGFIPGVTSGLNRFGVTWSFFLGEFLGVVLIFAGFLVSEDVFAHARWTWARPPKPEVS
ncbi:MAG: hypothetical protein E6I70_13845 [Chloroflexi bacterium]|nr:MAG: hypothetical protein E6I70_13845 [Chloroflexota bacterium]